MKRLTWNTFKAAVDAQIAARGLEDVPIAWIDFHMPNDPQGGLERWEIRIADGELVVD